MQILKDITAIRLAYKAASRRKILWSAFSKSDMKYKADMYFLLFIFMLLLAKNWQSTYWLHFIIPSIVFVIFLIRFDSALASIYPVSKFHKETNHNYRKDFTLLRFKIFSTKLIDDNIKPHHIEKNLPFLLKEHDLRESDSLMDRPIIFWLTTILVGVITAAAGIEKVWESKLGLYVVFLLVLSLGYAVLFFGFTPTRKFSHKELELFLNWYLHDVHVPLIEENQLEATPISYQKNSH